MKVSQVFLAVSLALTPVAAEANGSMGRSVNVIVVKPSREVRQFDEARRMRKAAETARKEETKRRLDEGRQLVKEMEIRQKEYQKKMDNWAKDLAKKSKKKK